MFDAMGAAGSADDINAMEIHHWYTKFMKECPSGQLCLHEFKHVLDLHGLTPEANSYVEQVFHTFDMNKVRIRAELPGFLMAVSFDAFRDLSQRAGSAHYSEVMEVI